MALFLMPLVWTGCQSARQEVDSGPGEVVQHAADSFEQVNKDEDPGETKAIPDSERSVVNSDVAEGETTRPPLERLVWQALMANPDAGIAESRVLRSEASLAQANSRFLPSLGLDTGYIRADAPSVFLFKSIDARSLAPGTDFNDPGIIDNFETGLTARYNFFNAGRDAIQRDLAQLDRSIAERGLEEMRNALVAQVGLAYFEILRAEELLKVAKGSVSTLESQVREKSAQFKAGAVLESEVLSLQARLAEARALQLRAENAVRTALTALRQVLGLPTEVNPLEFAQGDESELEAGSGRGPGLPSELSQALSEALLARPELEKVRAQVEASGLKLEDAKRAYLPRLDGVGRVYWDDAGMRYERENWWVGLTLSWDLFDGGKRGADRKLAQALAEEMRHADRKLTLAVEADVERAFYQLKEAQAQVDVARQGLSHAEKVYSMIEVSYRNGSATVTRFLEVEQSLLRARMQSIVASFDLQQAEISLLRAIGRWADPSQWPDWNYWNVSSVDPELKSEDETEN